MQVTYLPDSKRIRLVCDFNENRMISSLQGKRFMTKARHWLAPVIGHNARIILAIAQEHDSVVIDDYTKDILQKCLQKREFNRVPFPAWYPMKTTPYSQQSAALDRAWGLDRAAFFMEQGTGKSKVAIDLNSAHLLQGTIDCWVVFCPNSVRENWLGEITTHCPVEDVHVAILGDLTPANTARRVAAAVGASKCILVVGFESIQQKYRGGRVYDALVESLVDRRFSVTVDESHWVKSHDANRSRTVEFIASMARLVQIMTGTEVSKDLLDLYQQFEILDPEIIGCGSYYSFRNRYAIMGGYDNREVVGFQNVEELVERIRPYVYQCRKAECPDLPEKVYTKRFVTMTPEQARVYKQLDKEMESQFLDVSRRGASIRVLVADALAKYNALQQVTGGFVNYDDQPEEFIPKTRKTAWLVQPLENPKVRELIAVVEENPEAKIIVWAKFRHELASIAAGLRDKFGASSVVEYHGGVSTVDRSLNLAEFKKGRARFFVANQATGGTGLTINEANVVVYFSNSLKLVDRLQSEDRCHRIGQDKTVLYVDLVCRGTVDEKVIRSLSAKLDLAEYVKSEMKGGAGYA